MLDCDCSNRSLYVHNYSIEEYICTFYELISLRTSDFIYCKRTVNFFIFTGGGFHNKANVDSKFM